MIKHLQSRREFFKEASEKALPILGMAILASTPILNSCTKDPDPSGCNGCSNNCEGSSTSSTCSSCSNNCENSSNSSGCPSCSDNCSSGCNTECTNDCSSNCSNNANNSSNESISEASGAIDGHDYVDLGLSVKWARCNVNASLPQKNGICSNIKFYSYYDFQQVDIVLSLGLNGYTYYDKELGGIADFDIAAEKWGNNWRTPSQTEWEELKDNCDLELFEIEGVAGVKATSHINGKSIFIPLSGDYNSSNNSIEWVGSTVGLFSSTFNFEKWAAYTHLIVFNKTTSGGIVFGTGTPPWSPSSKRYFVRAVTIGSGGGSTNCNGNCTNTAQNNCSSCQVGCSTECTQQCSSNCSTGCKTDCTSSCPNGCNTLCGGACHYSCGGTCSYVSAGNSCTSGTCARTCSNYCYRTCTLACSESCMSCCITSSK